MKRNIQNLENGEGEISEQLNKQIEEIEKKIKYYQQEKRKKVAKKELYENEIKKLQEYLVKVQTKMTEYEESKLEKMLQSAESKSFFSFLFFFSFFSFSSLFPFLLILFKTN